MAKESAQDDHGGVRERILTAGLKLLSKGGREALTTRAIADAAYVQGPTIYRLFGDKEGLLHALAARASREYVAKKKANAPHPDPIEDLRFGWDLNVEFGLANPAIFSIINGELQSGRPSPMSEAGIDILKQKVKRVAQAGRLRVSEASAIELIRACGVGATMILIRQPPAERDLSLSATAREMVISQISNSPPASAKPAATTAAITLRASLDEASALSPGEKMLLSELLERLSSKPALESSNAWSRR